VKLLITQWGKVKLLITHWYNSINKIKGLQLTIKRLNEALPNLLAQSYVTYARKKNHSTQECRLNGKNKANIHFVYHTQMINQNDNQGGGN
jgi:hypothetical protein